MDSESLLATATPNHVLQPLVQTLMAPLNRKKERRLQRYKGMQLMDSLSSTSAPCGGSYAHLEEGLIEQDFVTFTWPVKSPSQELSKETIKQLPNR